MSTKKSSKGPKPKAAKPKSASSKSSTSKEISAPVARGRIEHPRKAVMTVIKDGIRVKHREYFSDVTLTANGTFNLIPGPFSTGWAINPGNADIFPWLSEIAMRFETYKFHKLEFEYVTMLPTSQSGALYMAVDYDAVDTPPTSKQVMLQYAGLARGPLWASFRHHSTLEQLHKIPVRNTLNQAVPSGTDPRLYNVGNLFLACDDVTGSNQRGEMWVDYDVELKTPQLAQTGDESTFQLAPGNNSDNMLAGATQVGGVSTSVRLRPDLGTSFLEFLKNGNYAYEGSYTTSAAGAATAPDTIARASGGNLVASAWGAPGVSAFANGITTAQLRQIAISNAPVIAAFTAGALNLGNTLSGTLRFTPL